MGKVLNIVGEIVQEFDNAINQYAPMNSAHEGYAVLKEEVDELWDEIKRKPDDVDMLKIRKEATQVAAMAIRIIHDVCDKGD